MSSTSLESPTFTLRVRLHPTSDDEGRRTPLAATSDRAYRPHLVSTDDDAAPMLGVMLSWSMPTEILPGEAFVATAEFIYPDVQRTPAARTGPGAVYRVVEGAREVGQATVVASDDTTEHAE